MLIDDIARSSAHRKVDARCRPEMCFQMHHGLADNEGVLLLIELSPCSIF
jgi:hypothetical protein